MDLLLFLLGFAALVGGAELLVRGASQLALALGVTPLVVGLTVVSMGTSAPEVAVSVSAALGGRVDIATGNVVGSNVFNVLFILGVSALIVPLTVDSQLVRQEVPIMIGASVLLVALGLDGNVGRLEAAMLLALLVAYTVMLVRQSRRQAALAAAAGQAAPAAGAAQPAGASADAASSGPARSGSRTSAAAWALRVAQIGGGLALLVIGSEWLVEAAIAFAKTLGVSDTVIGLTIVAAGTSMPEVATSITAAVRGERDIAVGNAVGSNVFNILGCLGLAGVVSADGLAVAPSLLNFDLWVMLAVALACLPVFVTGREIARWEGGLFLGYYVAYTAYLLLAAQQHDALPAFSGAMLSFVIPLTVVTLLVVTLRHSRQGGVA
jgi:cation:H+ antiporter